MTDNRARPIVEGAEPMPGEWPGRLVTLVDVSASAEYVGNLM
jgi:hypothetical protein